MNHKTTHTFSRAAMTLLVMLLTTATAWAQDPAWLKQGDSWDETTKTLTVNTATVASSAYQGNTQIENVIVSNSVTSIDQVAFNNCTNLKTVFVGNGVTSIGQGAFYSGANLKTVIMTRTSSAPQITNNSFIQSPNLKFYVPMDNNGNILPVYRQSSGWDNYYYSNYLVGSWLSGTCAVVLKNGVLTVVGIGALENCIDNNSRSNITSVIIEEGVTSIGNSAFYGCSNLESVHIGSGVTSIGESAFNDCDNLATITVDGNNQTFDSPEGSNAIIRTADNTLVAGCKTTVIPASVTSIGPMAFWGHDGLTSITIPDGVQSIGGDAFIGCSNLESVHIGSGVASIGEYAFSGCHKLAIITVDAGNQTFDSRDGCNAIIRKADNTLVAGCKTTVIPNSVQSIGKDAFNTNAGLTSITIPNSVTSIGAMAFMQCDGLRSVTIGSGVTSIGDRAFVSCNALESVTLNGVATIGTMAFDTYVSLTTVTIAEGLILYNGTELLSGAITDMSKLNGKTLQRCYSVTLPEHVTASGTMGVYNDNIYALPDATVTISAATGYTISNIAVNGTPISGNSFTMPGEDVTVTADVIPLSGTCGDNVTWEVTDTDQDGTYETLTISGTGAMRNYGSTNQPWAAFKSDITTVVIGDGVTSIGVNAFESYTALTSVTIASSVTYIGDGAFYGCTNLTTVSGASGVTYIGSSAFSGTAWENNLPNGLTYVGHVAYQFNADGTSVTLDEGTTQIYDNCFSESKITSIIIPASVASIESYALANSPLQKVYVLRNGSGSEEITQIVSYVFEGSSNLSDIVVPAAAYSHYYGMWYSYMSILKRGYTITCDEGITFTTTNNGPLVVEDETVTLSGTGTIPDGYTFAGYSVKDANNNDITVTETSGVYTFTMPDEDVTVTATWLKLMTNEDITIAIPSQTYTGNELTPVITVKDGETVLTLDEDYTVTAPSGPVQDTGDYTYTITGIGNYTGTKDAMFTIVYPTVTTSYVDATGTLHENVVAIPLINAMTTLPAGTYVVNSDVTYTSTVTLSGDVTLILADGCTMNIVTKDEPLYATIMNCQYNNLTIYGQSEGTGWLKAYCSFDYGIYDVKDYTQHSGNVFIFNDMGACINANNSVTLHGGTLDVESQGGAEGEIIAWSDISILGGKLWARNNGLWSPKGITLGYTNATDQIYVTIYHAYGTGLEIADGKTLVDDSGVIWSGALYDNQIGDINDRTLKPVMGVVLTKDGSGNISAEFDGTSLETVSIPVDVNVTSVTYERTFTDGRPATVMLPFNKPVSEIGGGKFYTFGGVEKTADKWIATMNEVTGSLTANTPYLFVPAGTSLTFTGGATLNTTGGGNCLASDTEGWEFHGTYERKVWDEAVTHDYGFAALSGTSVDGKDVEAGQFVRLTTGASAKPMRCYLSYVGVPNQARALTRGAAATDEELPSSIIVRLVGANGQTTAIGTIDTKTGEMTFDSEAWYTLDGVRLSGKPTKKGLYINNGKKIVIK